MELAYIKSQPYSSVQNQRRLLVASVGVCVYVLQLCIHTPSIYINTTPFFLPVPFPNIPPSLEAFLSRVSTPGLQWSVSALLLHICLPRSLIPARCGFYCRHAEWHVCYLKQKRSTGFVADRAAYVEFKCNKSFHVLFTILQQLQCSLLLHSSVTCDSPAFIFLASTNNFVAFSTFLLSWIFLCNCC